MVPNVGPDTDQQGSMLYGFLVNLLPPVESPELLLHLLCAFPNIT